MDANKRIQVIVADDDMIIQLAHRMALEAMGLCDVIIARDGAEAVRIAQEGNVDLILMDINMPILDGIAATIQIRSIAALQDLLIIGVTSNTEVSVHQRAKDVGMNDVLVKPVIGNTFKRILKGLVEETVCI